MPSVQSQTWPGTRAILLVHGIGNASTGGDGAFPLDVLRDVLGDEADRVAVYKVNYDTINDWVAQKVQCAAGISALKTALRFRFGNEGTDATIADYAGDVLWPVMSLSLRLAVRDLLVATLNQMVIDRGAAARARGDDPLDYGISIVAHSLGCFHTYEVLSAMATTATYRLRPRTDLFTLEAVVLMASPVQLIRTVASAISAFIPQQDGLATLAKPLAIPCEGTTLCTERFISITGSHDPVGGHLFGRRLDWAYMNVPGQDAVVVPQNMLRLDTNAALASALAGGGASGGVQVSDPHSWTAYIEGQGQLLREAILT